MASGQPPSARPEAGSARAPDGARATPESREPVVLDDTGIRRALMRISHELLERNEHPERLYLVAIPNGGVPLARQIARNLREIAGAEPQLGVLDTTLYRDDLGQTGERPPLRETEMPSSVDGRVVVLVEDVVNTGRTIRAAMDALMDFGRPAAVQVVALVDRGHRELPIKIDYVGKNIPTQPQQRVRLLAEGSGDEPMQAVLVSGDVADAERAEEPA